MWCAAYAVAKVTGWTRDDVWVHVRARKEARGEILYDDGPRGGIRDDDWKDALDRAGYQIVEEWSGRRRFPDFIRGRTGTWILAQHRHVFAWRPGSRHYNNGKHYRPIIRAYRVQRRKLTLV